MYGAKIILYFSLAGCYNLLEIALSSCNVYIGLQLNPPIRQLTMRETNDEMQMSSKAATESEYQSNNKFILSLCFSKQQAISHFHLRGGCSPAWFWYVLEPAEL